jgi:hypothetical protein
MSFARFHSVVNRDGMPMDSCRSSKASTLCNPMIPSNPILYAVNYREAVPPFSSFPPSLLPSPKLVIFTPTRLVY